MSEPLDSSFLVVESQVEVTSTYINDLQGKDNMMQDMQPPKKFTCDVCTKEYTHKLGLEGQLMHYVGQPKCSACRHYFKKI